MAYAEVIGDPIGHSKSPLIHRFWLEKLGLEADYRAEHVRAAGLGDYFTQRRQDRGWRGCNVTVPHKQAVIPYLSSLDPVAQEVGAVNLIYPRDGGLIGDNSDVAGILDALAGWSLPTGAEVCLIGSGGAALAAIAAFRRLGVGKLGINVRNAAKGRGLLECSGLEGRVGTIDDRENLTRASLIVNASILGMSGQPSMPETLLLALEGARNDALVLDMVYSPLETGLLRAARAQGLGAVDGLAMLVGQAAAAFERFFGAAAPREHDNGLRALLKS